MHKLVYKKTALKAIWKMPQPQAKKLLHELETMAQDPYSYQGDWKPMKGDPCWRLRLGSYRAICSIDDGELVVLVLEGWLEGRCIQMSAQIIEREGKPEYAVLPYEEYLKLIELAEDAQDHADAGEAMRELASGEDEAVPAEIVGRLISGDEHPLKVWREYRGLTQEALGRAAGIGKSYVSQIEAGNKSGSAKVLKVLAETLNVDIDDLLEG